MNASSETVVRDYASPQRGAKLKVPQMGIRWFALALLLCAVVAVFTLELMIGAVRIPLASVLRVLTGGGAEQAVWERIILDYRLPRALTALVAGAALGTTGLMMQTLFRNPLASPWTLGLTAGAQLGVAVAVIAASATGASLFASYGVISNIGLAGAASAGTVLVLLLVLSVSRRVGTVTLLIVGLMFNYLASALANLAIHFADEAQSKVFSNWSDGSFGSVTWGQLRIVVPVILIGLVVAHLLVKPLNALLLGETYARTLGLTVNQARRWSFASTAALAGAVTAFCGPVVFLGVAVPHLCRGLFHTSDHRVLMPTTALMGALLALSADFVTNLPWEKHVLHMNTVNALIGAPIVLWILLRRKNGSFEL